MRYDNNVVFFRIDSIHSPGRGSGFYSGSRQLAKPRRKYYAIAGIIVDADAATLCFHDFHHDGKLQRCLTKIVASVWDGGFQRKRHKIFELFSQIRVQQYLLVVQYLDLSANCDKSDAVIF